MSIRVPPDRRISIPARAGLLILILGMAMLGGCDSFSLPDWLQDNRPTATISLPPIPTTSATREVVQPTATPSGPITLTVWVPPRFQPDMDTPEGLLLARQLQQFEEDNPGILVNIRVKDETGSNGLLETLMITRLAAPAAVPSLVILPRSDVELAVKKDAILPLEGVTEIMEDLDWYPYARQLAVTENTLYGFPFAGEGLLLLRRPARTTSAPRTWEELILWNEKVVFAGSDPNGMLPMFIYQAYGGSIADDEGHPGLQISPLTQTLDVFNRAAQQNVFTEISKPFQTEEQAWQAYKDLIADAAITSSTVYLANPPADTAAVPLPSINSSQVGGLDGWVICMTDTLPERRALALRLAESLVDATFQAQWSEEAGYLPTRPSALAAWKNQSFQNLLNSFLPTAPAIPDAVFTSRLGPILKDATLQVLDRNLSPIQAAQEALKQLGTQ